MHLAPNGKVFSVAPSEVTRYLDAAGTGAWSVVATRNSGYRGYGSSVLYADGKVLHLGGGDPPTNAAEVIDLNQAIPTWRSVAPMAIARRHANATILPDGKVLVTGGTSGPGFNNTTTPVFEAEMWDPTTEAWTTMAAAQVPRLYHSVAVLLPDGRIFSAGGNGYSQVEIYEPPVLVQRGAADHHAGTGERVTWSGILRGDASGGRHCGSDLDPASLGDARVQPEPAD